MFGPWKSIAMVSLIIYAIITFLFEQCSCSPDATASTSTKRPMRNLTVEKEVHNQNRWKEVVLYVCSNDNIPVTLLGELLKCNRQQWEEDYVEMCDNEAYGETMSPNDRRKVECDLNQSKKIDKLFLGCYIKSNYRYARDFLEAHEEYLEKKREKGKYSKDWETYISRKGDKTRNVRYSEVDCMKNVNATYLNIWEAHVNLTVVFCESNYSDASANRLFECGLISWTSTERRLEKKKCFDKAFDGLTGAIRGKVFCDPTLAEAKLEVREKFASCYHEDKRQFNASYFTNVNQTLVVDYQKDNFEAFSLELDCMRSRI